MNIVNIIGYQKPHQIIAMCMTRVFQGCNTFYIIELTQVVIVLRVVIDKHSTPVFLQFSVYCVNVYINYCILSPFLCFFPLGNKLDSLSHSVTHSLTHSLTQSLSHSHTHSLVHSSFHPFIHPSTHPSTHPSIHPPTHPSTHPSIHPPTLHSFTHSLIHSYSRPGEMIISHTVKSRLG